MTRTPGTRSPRQCTKFLLTVVCSSCTCRDRIDTSVHFRAAPMTHPDAHRSTRTRTPHPPSSLCASQALRDLNLEPARSVTTQAPSCTRLASSVRTCWPRIDRWHVWARAIPIPIPPHPRALRARLDLQLGRRHGAAWWSGHDAWPWNRTHIPVSRVAKMFPVLCFALPIDRFISQALGLAHFSHTHARAHAPHNKFGHDRSSHAVKDKLPP